MEACGSRCDNGVGRKHVPKIRMSRSSATTRPVRSGTVSANAMVCEDVRLATFPAPFAQNNFANCTEDTPSVSSKTHRYFQARSGEFDCAGAHRALPCLLPSDVVRSGDMRQASHSTEVSESGFRAQLR